jgi:methylthioribose-1-phosphate isomerase
MTASDTPLDPYARYDHIRPIRWTGDALELLDQRRLPFSVEYLRCEDSDAVVDAIRELAVRGAPAIGIAAAWGTVLAACRWGAARRTTWRRRC